MQLLPTSKEIEFFFQQDEERNYIESLIWAIESLEIDLVKNFLNEDDKRFNKNGMSLAGQTVLAHTIHEIEEPQKTIIFDLLMYAGLDPNQKNEDGWNPLSCAIAIKNEHMVKELIKVGANVNGVSDDNEPVLHDAIKSLPNVVELLLQKGANPNTKSINKVSYNALELAIQHHPAILSSLVKHGGDLKQKTSEGSLLDFASFYGGSYEIIKQEYKNLSIKDLKYMLKISAIDENKDFFQTQIIEKEKSVLSKIKNHSLPNHKKIKL